MSKIIKVQGKGVSDGRRMKAWDSEAVRLDEDGIH